MAKDEQFLRLPMGVMDWLAAAHLTGAEYQIVLFLLRKTTGWAKEREVIPLSCWTSGTGLPDETVRQRLRLLVERGVIRKEITDKGRVMWSLAVEGETVMAKKKEISAERKAEIQEVYDTWNAMKNLKHHRRLTDVMEGHINKALDDFKGVKIGSAEYPAMDVIKWSIGTLDFMIESPRYFWTYDHWTLSEFLTREGGLNTLYHPDNVKKYLKGNKRGKAFGAYQGGINVHGSNR